MSSVEEIFSNNSGEIQYSYLKIMQKSDLNNVFYIGYFSFITLAKYSEKLTFLTP